MTCLLPHKQHYLELSTDQYVTACRLLHRVGHNKEKRNKIVK